MQTEYTLQASAIRGIYLQFDTFQTLNHDKGEIEIRHLGFIFVVVVVVNWKSMSLSMSWYVSLML